MNLRKNTVFFLIIASFASSCSKSDQSPLRQLTFKLVVLDENDEKRNVLENGKNFSIGFEVTNHSNDSVLLSQEVGKELFRYLYKQSDFLAIYRKKSAGKGQEDELIGKPYDSSVELAFPAILLPGYFIKVGPSGRQYVFMVPWTTNPANQEIPSGSYYSTFQGKFVVEDVEIPIDTKIEFEVN